MCPWFPLLFAALTGRSGHGLAQSHEIHINRYPSLGLRARLAALPL